MLGATAELAKSGSSLSQYQRRMHAAYGQPPLYSATGFPEQVALRNCDEYPCIRWAAPVELGYLPEIRLEANNGPNNNLQVAQRAIAELRQGQAAYDLVLNNCESFVNRAMHGNSSNSQIINTALAVVALVGLYHVLKNSR
jgi:hypothetical protein